MPMMLIGSDMFNREEGEEIYKLLLSLSYNGNFINPNKHWNGFNILHRELGNIGALELGVPLYNKNKSKITPKLVYLLNCDEFESHDIPNSAYVIYQGTNGDKGAKRADFILPGAAYLEKSSTYVSTEGRVNVTSQVSL